MYAPGPGFFRFLVKSKYYPLGALPIDTCLHFPLPGLMKSKFGLYLKDAGVILWKSVSLNTVPLLFI